MKLRNKKTGEICNLFGISCKGMRTFLQFNDNCGNFKFECDSLAELNEEWEDYEEPKGYWFIDCAAPYPVDFCEFNEDTESDKEIGNYFETKEEAEKAVEKLKAWKRLRDKGFMITLQGCKGNAWLQANWGNLQGDYSDVLLLFGGEK